MMEHRWNHEEREWEDVYSRKESLLMLLFVFWISFLSRFVFSFVNDHDLDRFVI